MAAAHESIVYDVLDFKVYELLTDSVGASPTYGAAVDVPGISDVSLEPNLVTSELTGDSRVMARRGRTDRFKLSATYSKIALDVLDVILGGTVTDVSSSAATWKLAAPASLPYFKAEFLIDDVDVGLGNIIARLYKCQLTGGTLINQSYNAFGKPTFALEAIQPDFATLPMGEIDFYTTEQQLSA